MTIIGDLSALHVREICRPGDVLLYTPAGTFGTLITYKTWGDFSHAELYLGREWVDRCPDAAAENRRRDQSGEPWLEVWASRDPLRWLPRPTGGGVNFYELRTAHLALIRRPIDTIALDQVVAFCTQTRGQSYDWWALMRFFKVGDGACDRMFCSEAVTRALRRGGVQLFANADCDDVSPQMLAWTTDLKDEWRATARRVREDA